MRQQRNHEKLVNAVTNTPDMRLVPVDDDLVAGLISGLRRVRTLAARRDRRPSEVHTLDRTIELLSALADSPSPSVEARGNVVEWHKASDAKPEPGHKFVALYDDGSGAWLGFAHDGGIIDSDGDDYEKMKNAEWWAYLPTGFRLCCEDHPDEQWEVQLPAHVCPPITPSEPAGREELREKVASRVRALVSGISGFTAAEREPFVQSETDRLLALFQNTGRG